MLMAKSAAEAILALANGASVPNGTENIPPETMPANDQFPEPVKTPVEPLAPKKYKTIPEGMNTGKFSEDEVIKFREGLDLYGREWSKVSFRCTKVQHKGLF